MYCNYWKSRELPNNKNVINSNIFAKRLNSSGDGLEHQQPFITKRFDWLSWKHVTSVKIFDDNILFFESVAAYGYWLTVDCTCVWTLRVAWIMLFRLSNQTKALRVSILPLTWKFKTAECCLRDCGLFVYRPLNGLHNTQCSNARAIDCNWGEPERAPY